MKRTNIGTGTKLALRRAPRQIAAGAKKLGGGENEASNHVARSGTCVTRCSQPAHYQGACTTSRRHRRQPGPDDSKREDACRARRYCGVLRATGGRREVKG